MTEAVTTGPGGRAAAGRRTPRYRLCPRCGRATPEAAGETFCPNDGSRLLTACPHCDAPITSPYGLYCVRCGRELAPDDTEDGGHK